MVPIEYERGLDRLMVETRSQPTLLIAILLLALANLALLGERLWPWQAISSLPGNGTAGFNPFVALGSYIALALWIGCARTEGSRKALFWAALLGMLAGMFLVAQVAAAGLQTAGEATRPDTLQTGLLVIAALIIALVGLRTAKLGYNTGFCMVCAIWASMVSCLMAVSAVQAQAFLNIGSAGSGDPWLQYHYLPAGTPDMLSLVQSLDTLSAFLLVGPIVGAIIGAIFASFGPLLLALFSARPR